MKSAFSDKEIAQAIEYSPAILRYTELLRNQPQIDKQADPKIALRLTRHFYWREAALSTFFARQSTKQIARSWSDNTDYLVLKAWGQSGGAEANLLLLAMGKLGARELNLSSDIDLIVIATEPINPSHAKVLKVFRELLSESTETGFCYRLDFNLRPGGNDGPLIGTLKQFEDYLWTQAELWERLAYVRMRVIAGPKEGRGELSDLVQRFVYRKFLDFSILEEFKNLRSRIRHEYVLLPTKEHWNLKHSPGGIRDLELFIHSLQVMHGGRIASLRTFSTDEAVDSIVKNELFQAQSSEQIRKGYWELRELEHFMQIRNDLQTYEWLDANDLPARLKQLALENFLRLDANRSIIERILGQFDTSAGAALSTSASELLKPFATENFDTGDFLNRWHAVKSADRNPTRERQRKELVLAQFVASLPKPAIKPEVAFENMLEFLSQSKSRSGLLDLLVTHPEVLKDLAVLFGSSPYLARIIISRPELLDSFFYRQVEIGQDDEQDFLERIFEQRLLNEIIAGIEYLKGDRIEDLFFSQTNTADQVCTAILGRITDQLQNEELQIMALGKWGAREMGFKSDLDFIFISAHPATEVSFKAAKRFVSRVSEPHRGGAIYGVDLRLRPSGKAGPMIVSHDQLLDYFKHQAAPWERQSYLLARVIGEPDSPIIRELMKIILSRGLPKESLASLRDIKNKLLRHSPESTADFKYNPGGLVDIELTLQTLFIMGQIGSHDRGSIHLLNQAKRNDENWEPICMNYLYFKRLEQQLRLLSGFKETQVASISAFYPQLCALQANDNLLQDLRIRLEANEKALAILDPVRKPI